ncbi:hypothetical protein PV10_01037 [Exophiala mesophila]|uniref:Uncharacterized protein n=1 Tax=Exophiala mesophila TaxID=212818 RepID=A0A0D1ZTL1_EXOME|nr:uncharacterized protein PV10_01037 [Exophiala mesophila]KIV97269.1 hypothetical protein PV10_01037 [Exophiala mesophila]
MAQQPAFSRPIDVVAENRHLKYLLKSHHQQPSISRYEHSQGGELLASSHLSSLSNVRDQEDVQGLLIPSHPLCHAHTLVIEDVSSDLIVALERILRLDAELFAAHLTNCGWKDSERGKDAFPFGDSEYSTWWTRRFKKQFFSIKWHRPYVVNFDWVPSAVESSLRVSPASLTLDLGAKSQVYQRSSNFRRAFLDLRTTNAIWDYSRATASNLQRRDQLVAEERLTIWKGEYRGHGIVLLLVDPEFGTVSNKVSYEGGRTAQFRASTKPQLAVPRSPVIQPSPAPRSETEEPSSLQREELPISSSASVDSQTEHPDQNSAHQTSRNSSAVATQGGMDDASLQPESSQTGQQQSQAFFPPEIISPDPPPFRSKSFFMNVACRGPESAISTDRPPPSGLLSHLTSTREDLSLWLTTHHLPIEALDSHSQPLCRIFEIIHADTLDFLLSIETFLDNILSNSDNEVVLENNIRIWRSLLNITGGELRYLTRQIPKFTEFLVEVSSCAHDQDDNASKTSSQQQLLREISRIQERLDKTLITLVSSLSVVESRRAIVEAESVSKLTELAFVFIPLSFAGTFFGMQVRQLDPETTSITWFWVMAIALVATSYGVRLLIRSQAILHAKKVVGIAIRQNANLTESQPIGTRAAIAALGRLLIPLIHESLSLQLLVAAIFLVIPLISIWANGGLVHGMVVVISICVALLVAFTLLMLCLRPDDNLRPLAEWIYDSHSRARTVPSERDPESAAERPLA